MVKVTRWGIGIIRRELHFGSKVASVVKRVGVNDDESYFPRQDVVFIKLQNKGYYDGTHPGL